MTGSPAASLSRPRRPHGPARRWKCDVVCMHASASGCITGVVGRVEREQAFAEKGLLAAAGAPVPLGRGFRARFWLRRFCRVGEARGRDGRGRAQPCERRRWPRPCRSSEPVSPRPIRKRAPPSCSRRSPVAVAMCGLENGDARTLPRSSEVRATALMLSERFPARGVDPITVIAAGDADDPAFDAW